MGDNIVYINVLARVYKLITGWWWLLLITCLTLGYMELIESMAANGLKLTYDWGDLTWWWLLWQKMDVVGMTFLASIDYYPRHVEN